MSGIELLLKSALDYERTHQIVLYTLLKESSLASYIFGIQKPTDVLWEPKGQLFDLAVQDKEISIYIEMKMWSSFTESQLQRQSQFLTDNHHQSAYVLLGTTWFEYSEEKIQRNVTDTARKIGYEELIAALNALLTATDQSQDIYELTLAYRNALQRQFDFLTKAVFSPNRRDRVFYYSLYWSMQQKLNGVPTAIYSVNNPGGPVYILNNEQWYPTTIDDVEVDLCYEVDNDKLCIKFYADTPCKNKKFGIRETIRRAVHTVLDEQYIVVDTGRLGAYMTACQIKHDFSDVSQLDKSVGVFTAVHCAMPRILYCIHG